MNSATPRHVGMGCIRNQVEQANKQYSYEVSVSVLASMFLPYLLSMMVYNLQAKTNLFPPKLFWANVLSQ